MMILKLTAFEVVPTPTAQQIAVHNTLVHDPKDIHAVLAAINAKVDYLVNSDKDLTA